jgi:GNAT superfamily N-acetyltransferase
MGEGNFEVVRLEPDITVVPFDCGDKDLNNFLTNDAIVYQKERFAVTHVLVPEVVDEGPIAGYFCLLTDKLAFDPSDEKQRKEWKTFNKQNRIHFNKHRKTYPSAKIGRLAISSAFAGQGLGSYLINRIFYMVNDLKDIGCRFITVDAYQDAFDFYLKNGFQFLSDDDREEQTRQMYFDMKRFPV